LRRPLFSYLAQETTQALAQQVVVIPAPGIRGDHPDERVWARFWWGMAVGHSQRKNRLYARQDPG